MAKKTAPAPALKVPDATELPDMPADLAERINAQADPAQVAREANPPAPAPQPDETSQAAPDDTTSSSKAPQWLTDDLLARAKSFGFDGEAAQFSSAEHLSSTLDRFAKLALLGRQQAAPQQQQPPANWMQWAQSQVAPAQQPPPAQQAAPYPQWPTQPAAQPVPQPSPAPVPSPQLSQQQAPTTAFQWPEDLRTDPLIQNVDGHLRSLQAEIRSLRAEREQEKARETTVQFERHMSWFDKKCQSDPHLVDVLGQGSLLHLDPRGSEAQSRVKLLKAVEGLQDGFARAGVRMTMDQVYEEAKRIVFGKQLSLAIARAQNQHTTNRLRQRNGQFVNSPRPRNVSAAEVDAELAAALAGISERTGIAVK